MAYLTYIGYVRHSKEKRQMTRSRLWTTAIATLGVALVAWVLVMPRGPETDVQQSQIDWLSAVSDMAQGGFERPSGAEPVDLPQDHSVHPRAQSELWQFSAHLAGPDGAPVNVQFSLMRLGIIPSDSVAPAANWELRGIYRAHLIVTHDTHTVAEERLGRDTSGMAGFDTAARELHFDNWTLTFPNDSLGDAWHFSATSGDVSVALKLKPKKRPILPDGQNAPFRGYAFTRLATAGTLTAAGVETPIAGDTWFDHVWGELPLPGAGPVTSDRLLIQLDNNQDLSIIVSQRRDGRGAPTVDAVLLAADGTIRPLGADLGQVDFTRYWQGTHTQWPVVWKVRLDNILDLDVVPISDAQEHDFTPPVWSGMVQAEGTFHGARVRGTGILQLAGDRHP
jgi:predicted secreted hydrolase